VKIKSIFILDIMEFLKNQKENTSIFSQICKWLIFGSWNEFRMNIDGDLYERRKSTIIKNVFFAFFENHHFTESIKNLGDLPDK
jgi:hypothetical protein